MTDTIQQIHSILAESEKRAEAATKGPWHVAKGGLGNSEKLDTVYACNDDLNYVAACRDFACHFEPARNTDNAAFIAAARADLPSRDAALRVAVEALEKMEREVYTVRDWSQPDKVDTSTPEGKWYMAVYSFVVDWEVALKDSIARIAEILQPTEKV